MAQLVDRLNAIADKLGSKSRGKTIEDAIILIEEALNNKPIDNKPINNKPIDNKPQNQPQKNFENASNNKPQNQYSKNFDKKPKPAKTEAKESFFNPTTESNDKE